MPEELDSVLYETAEINGIHICGLMTIPPICEENTELCKFLRISTICMLTLRAKNR